MIRLEKCKKVHNFKRNKDIDDKGDSYPWVPNPYRSTSFIFSPVETTKKIDENRFFPCCRKKEHYLEKFLFMIITLNEGYVRAQK
jgi:hypothetical protein